MNVQLRDPESMIKEEGENQDNVMSGSPRIESISSIAKCR